MRNSSAGLVTLESSDGEMFMVEESVAVMSRTIRNKIEADGADQIIAVRDVSGEILSKVIEFCRWKRFESAVGAFDEEEVEAWEHEFLRVNKSTLHHLDRAAVRLGINSLMDLTFQELKKDMTTGIAEQEIRKKTRIEKDYTEEEEKLRKTDDPVDLKLGRESTEEEESELRKQCSIGNDRPEERDLGKESPEYTEEEENEFWKELWMQYRIRKRFGPAKEIDFLKNLGKKSPEFTREERIELLKQCRIRKRFGPPKEMDLLKNFGMESTGKRQIY